MLNSLSFPFLERSTSFLRRITRQVGWTLAWATWQGNPTSLSLAHHSGQTSTIIRFEQEPCAYFLNEYGYGLSRNIRRLSIVLFWSKAPAGASLNQQQNNHKKFMMKDLLVQSISSIFLGHFHWLEVFWFMCAWWQNKRVDQFNDNRRSTWSTWTWCWTDFCHYSVLSFSTASSTVDSGEKDAKAEI